MKRLFVFFLILVISVLGLGFTVLNAESVQVNLYFGTHSLPLALVVLLSFAAGSVAGILASMALVISEKRENRRLKLRADVAEREIRNLRAIPIQDRR